MPQRFQVEPRIARRERCVTCGAGEHEWVYIGRLAEIGRRKDVRLGLDQEHVLAIVGKRGSGKSFTLGSLLEGLATLAPSTPINVISKSRATLLFDTLNIFQWMTSPVTSASGSARIAEQARLLSDWGVEPVELEVELWVPAGFEDQAAAAARPFRVRTADMGVADWAALLGVDSVQDTMGQLVAIVYDKVVRSGWTSDGGFEPPKEDYTLGDLLSCLRDDVDVQRDYAPATIRAVRQRLAAYDATPLFGPHGTDLTELLEAGKLSVMLLSGVPDDLRLVVIFLLIRRLAVARAAASQAQKSLELAAVAAGPDREALEQTVRDAPPKTWVVVDEAQNVFPSERQTAASGTLLRFVREGRNFGLSLAFTTQQPTAIDARIMAQVDTFVVHTLTVQRDIAAVLNNLKSREPDRIALRGRVISTADAIRALDVGQAFVSAVDSERCLIVDVRPRVSPHGGFES